MKKAWCLAMCLFMAAALFGCANRGNADLLQEIERLKTENEALRQASEEAEDSGLDSDETAEEIDGGGAWEVRHYVDEFNEPTGKSFVSNKESIAGTFSNSATTNSSLQVMVVADKDAVSFLLFEYGSHVVKNSSSRNSEAYRITMKTDGIGKESINGVIPAGGDRIVISGTNRTPILRALNREGASVSFYIEEAERSTTSYLFTIEASNFHDEYVSLE